MAKTLTEADIIQANTYLPLDIKAALARQIAAKCVNQVEVSVKDSGKSVAMPPRFQENPRNKMLYGMFVLLDQYLKKLDSEKDFTSQEYDTWGESAILNQLDRMKMNKAISQDVRNRVYDLVDDYREFYRMLNAEIAALVEAQNDPVARISALIGSLITPDAIKGAKEALEEAQKELKAYEAQRKELKAE